MIDDAYLAKKRRQANHKFLNRSRGFLKRIGLPLVEVPSYEPDPAGSFFTGCWIAKSAVHYCPARVQVGEFLHECGHLALLPESVWHQVEPGMIPAQIAASMGWLKNLGDFAVEAWDYAAAARANIPSLAVFAKGFGGEDQRLQMWECFERRHHPGFGLLRALDMSREWGQLNRWFIGWHPIPDTDEALYNAMDRLTAQELKALQQAMEKMKNGES